MTSNLKTYEQKLRAKNHYRQLLSAKTTLRQFHNPPTAPLPLSHTLSPQDRYEYYRTNLNIRSKLKDIYRESADRIKQQRRRSKRHSKQVVFSPNKTKDQGIDSQNIKMFERIMAAKSTIGQQLKHRDTSLNKYSSNTRKKITLPDDSLFIAFREILVESKASAGRRSLRPSSARQSYKFKNRPNSGRKSTFQVGQIRQSL